MTQLPKLLTVFFGVTALLTGCASERDPIDRVQPNYLDKDYLKGEWYYQRTVVDVPGADGFTFVGATDFGGLSRLRWDIQENFLYGRRTTELIKNADGKVEEGEGYMGEVIAAFAIQSHFDIQRPYNSATGEELNILEENAYDRPWYERQYIRVDWSQNQVHNYQLDWEAQSVESVPYYVQEFDPITGERHPDAPMFEDGYFDVTNKLFAKAGTIEYDDYGQIPLCWLYDFRECGASEYTIRNSFLRIDPNHQYEAMPYKGKATEVFGFFDTTRMVFDPETGIREQGKERYLNRYNIWEESFRNNQTLPLKYRRGKPIVFHVNRDWPADDVALNAAAKNVETQWNKVFVDVVEAANAILPSDRRMFVLCPNNPVKPGDHAACGKAGDAPRIGDMRYSFLVFVPKYMTYGLLGLGPNNSDPETGEVISGAANVYQHNNGAAYNVLEMVELLAGIRGTDDFIDGVDLSQWIDEVQNGNGQEYFGLDDASTMVDRIANGPASRYWDGERRAPTPEDEAYQREHGFKEWARPFLAAMHDRGLSAKTGDADARLATLRGTEIESMLVNDDIYLAMGFPPEAQLSASSIEQASILRGGFAEFAMKRERIFEDFSAKRNMYTMGMADDALMGLARHYAPLHCDNGPDTLDCLSSDEILEELRETIYTAVLTHEAGHVLGLMHNFGGSDDAINYHDEYWQIRDDGNVGPRLTDPITDDERNAEIYNYAYSSIMDYAGRYTIDGKGVGKYDRAAMLFGYAGKVEVFENLRGLRSDYISEWYSSDGDPLMFWTVGPEAPHYTYYYEMMGEDLYQQSNRTLVDVSEFSDDFSRAGNRMRVPYVYCSHSRSNLGDSCLTRDFGADSMERMQNILDDLNTWYILRSFPRGQIGVDSWGYVSRNYSRVYDRLKQWNDLYSLYKDWLPQFYTPAELGNFFTDPASGWGNKTWAVQNAFNHLVKTVLMPEPGGHDLTTMADGSQLVAPSPYIAADYELDITDGRFYQTSWQNPALECGYTWWECLHHIGFYLDKIMAIYALSDSSTNFVGRSTPEDIREWEISYYNTFPDQIAKINSAITSQNWAGVGPYLNAQGHVEFPNYAGTLDTPMANTVSPQATFSIQLYWQVLGKARFISNFDPTFAEDSRLFEMGSGSAPDLDTANLVVFKEPFTGITYGAINHPGRSSAGAEAIRHANALKARSEYCGIDGNPATDCVVPSGGHSREGVTAQLRSHTQLLKAMLIMDNSMQWGDAYQP